MTETPGISGSRRQRIRNLSVLTGAAPEAVGPAHEAGAIDRVRRTEQETHQGPVKSASEV